MEAARSTELNSVPKFMSSEGNLTWKWVLFGHNQVKHPEMRSPWVIPVGPELGGVLRGEREGAVKTEAELEGMRPERAPGAPRSQERQEAPSPGASPPTP